MVSLASKLTAAAILTVSLAAPAWAQLSPQMQKLNECNIKASALGYTGETRKSYVNACVNGQQHLTPVSKALSATQQKTSACEDQANTQKLGGEARQTFLKSCLR
jgi:hypothetical protein